MFENWKRDNIDKYNHMNKKNNTKKEIDPEKAKIIRKLKHKTKYLDIEYEEVLDLLSEAKLNFFNTIREYCTKNPTAENPLQPIEQEREKGDNNKNVDSEEVKSIYREIVKATHPDKNPGTEEEAKEIFINASQAKEQNKIEDLINISFDLDIDISDISIGLIEEIENSLLEKELEIQKMRKDTAIQWYNSPQDIKNKLIEQICPTPDK
jgi:hypothetical protein